MATKVFSSRADEGSLAFADALARKEYGLSFGQYCGTVLLRSIETTGRMPQLESKIDSDRKKRAASFIKGFSSRSKNPNIGRLSDDEIRDMIASRYE